MSAEPLDRTGVVFVMERAHKTRLAAQCSAHLRHKKIVCLDSPGRYAYMQPERKAGPFLRA